jgi:hypothetical protein
MTTARVSACGLLGLVICVTVVGIAGATMLPLYPRKLDPEMKVAIGAAACRSAGGKIDTLLTYSYERRAKAPINAAVTCAAESVLEGRPVKSKVDCVNEGGGWKCEEPTKYVALGVGVKQTFVVAEPSNGVKDRIEAVEYLLGLGMYLGYNIHDLVVGNVCAVKRGKTQEWIVECNLASLNVARDCVAQDCRFRLFGVEVAVP